MPQSKIIEAYNIAIEQGFSDKASWFTNFIVASNKAVRNALCNLLGNKIIVPKYDVVHDAHKDMGAIGAALLIKEKFFKGRNYGYKDYSSHLLWL